MTTRKRHSPEHKRLLADGELEEAALKEIARENVRAGVRTGATPGCRAPLDATMGVSERFACRVTGQRRATQRHEPAPTTPADPDAALRAWLREWAAQHPRRGFRNAFWDARADGWVANHKKVQRVWCEEGLRVPQHHRRKLPGTSTALQPVADAPKGFGRSTSSSTPPPTGVLSRSSPSVTIADEHIRDASAASS